MDTQKEPKFIVVLGTSVSGLGKGVAAASIGTLLKSAGINVVPVKLDGYLNVDCGTMSPLEHGEVFVLNDGSEVDLDFGTYERFLDMDLSGQSSLTGGNVFDQIIKREREGAFLGEKLTYIPHITDHVKRHILDLGINENAEVVMIEVGGTVGDIENSYFIEAMRQLSFSHDVFFIQLVPLFEKGDTLGVELVKDGLKSINSYGIMPNALVVRTSKGFSKDTKDQIGRECNFPTEAIFDDPNLNSQYSLPIRFKEQDLLDLIAHGLRLELRHEPDLEDLTGIADIISKREIDHRIAIVGKYVSLKDSYLSVIEALQHAAAFSGYSVDVDLIESEIFEDTNSLESLNDYDGIVVPGGYGMRGVEGMIEATKFARENNLPYLGLCLGLHIMAIEYARNICELHNANSTELDENTKYPIIDFMTDQRVGMQMGATNRLGAHVCNLDADSLSHLIYGETSISERHRHRRSLNLDFLETLIDKDLIIGGWNQNRTLVEIIEWPTQFTFGIATQAHAELKSRPLNPSPLFLAFDLASHMHNKSPTSEMNGRLFHDPFKKILHERSKTFKRRGSCKRLFR